MAVQQSITAPHIKAELTQPDSLVNERAVILTNTLNEIGNMFLTSDLNKYSLSKDYNKLLELIL